MRGTFAIIYFPFAIIYSYLPAMPDIWIPLMK